MKITIPSVDMQFIQLENERLRQQIDLEHYSALSETSESREDYQLRKAQSLYTSAQQGKLAGLIPEIWLLVLLESPQSAVYCPCLSAFSAQDLVELLKRHPQLAEFCEEFHIFLYDQIMEVVLAQPELLCRFQPEVIDWAVLLQKAPETFAPLCCNWHFSAEEWGRILKTSPRLQKYSRPENWDDQEWNTVLQSAPHLLQECPCISQWGERQWGELLARQSQLAGFCPCRERLSPETWRELLAIRPRLIFYCPNPEHPAVLVGFLAGSLESAVCVKDWNCFSLYDWLFMLRTSRKLESYCPCWERFSIPHWWNLLCHQPGYAGRCPVIERFTEEDWLLLCRKYPELKKYRS